MDDYRLEPLTEAHAGAVTEIFNQFVGSSFAAYPSAPVDESFFHRLAGLAQGYPSVAVIAPDGSVAGFGMLRRWHPADSFARTAEVTYFIRPEHTGRGLGRMMLERFETEARRLVIHGFFHDLIRKIGVPELEDQLRATVEAELAATVGAGER